MMSMSLRMTINCIVCDQERDDEAVAEARTEAALFGSVRFGLCPKCNRKAPHPFDSDYRRRAREFLAGEPPPEREGFKLFARRQKNGYVWIYREVATR